MCRRAGEFAAQTPYYYSSRQTEFFSLKKKGEANGKPGLWDNADDGRELRTYVRNTSYSVEWGECSRLEILVGRGLKDEYGLGHRERLRFEVRGDPNWKEYENQGRLELVYDEQAHTFRAFQPVTIDTSRLAHPLASEEAVTRNRRFLVAHRT